VSSTAHDRLVVDLAALLGLAGFVVTRGEMPGYRRARAIHGRRPDLVAAGLHRAERVIGEAKTPDDIFSPRSLDQYAAFAGVPVPGKSMSAHLVLAVPGYHALRAWRALALAGVDGRRVTVAAKLPGRWWITYQPQGGVATWPLFGVAIRGPSSRFAGPCSQLVSAAGASTDGTFLDVLT
jgi:hypothetical protein